MVEIEVARRMEEYYSEIERRILAGERDFEVTAPLSDQPVRFQVPGWFRRPYRRARFEWALRKRRAALAVIDKEGEGE